MTTLPTPTALAIIASHGADPARWPAEDRAALLVLAAADADVAAALADARTVDAAVAGWLAQAPPALAIDVAAITRLPQAGPAPRRWRPAALAGSLAASLAIVLAVGGWLGLDSPSGNGAPTIAAAAPPSAGTELAEADAAFAYVFTPTAAEEELI